MQALTLLHKEEEDRRSNLRFVPKRNQKMTKRQTYITNIFDGGTMKLMNTSKKSDMCE